MLTTKTTIEHSTPGELLRNYRLTHGMTLEQLGAKLYCSRAELSLIENHKKPISRMKKLLWSTIVPEWTPDMLTNHELPEIDDD